MKTYKNEISCHRGETFTISKTIEYLDGSPFVCPMLHNPYLILSVSSTQYWQTNSYIKNYWLTGFKTFQSTKPFDITKLTADAAGQNRMFPDGLNEITSLTGEKLFTGYYNGELVDYLPTGNSYIDGSIFKDIDGKYYYGVVDEGNVIWNEYKFQLVKTFLADDTAKWTGQSYWWMLQLVSGVENMSWLEGLCTERSIAYDKQTPTTDDAVNAYCKYLYDLLVDDGYSFMPNYSYDQALGKIDTSSILLPATKILVLSNLKGAL